jgi:hypothetical protein
MLINALKDIGIYDIEKDGINEEAFKLLFQNFVNAARKLVV